MNIILVIIILIAIFSIILYMRLKDQKKQINSDNDKELEEMNYEKDFFQRTQAGEKSQLLMSLASQKGAE